MEDRVTILEPGRPNKVYIRLRAGEETFLYDGNVFNTLGLTLGDVIKISERSTVYSCTSTKIPEEEGPLVAIVKKISKDLCREYRQGAQYQNVVHDAFNTAPRIYFVECALGHTLATDIEDEHSFVIIVMQGYTVSLRDYLTILEQQPDENEKIYNITRVANLVMKSIKNINSPRLQAIAGYKFVHGRINMNNVGINLTAEGDIINCVISNFFHSKIENDYFTHRLNTRPFVPINIFTEDIQEIFSNDQKILDVLIYRSGVANILDSFKFMVNAYNARGEFPTFYNSVRKLFSVYNSSVLEDFCETPRYQQGLYYNDQNMVLYIVLEYNNTIIPVSFNYLYIFRF